MEYKILDVKAGNVWNSPYGEMQSYSLALEGVGEPVVLNKKCPVKNEPKVGETLYGTLEEKTNQKGNVYMKFTAQKPPEATGQAQSSNWHESPEKQQSINRAVALNNAILFCGTEAKGDYSIALKYADAFYAWLTKTEADKWVVEDVKEVIEGDRISLDDIPF